MNMLRYLANDVMSKISKAVCHIDVSLDFEAAELVCFVLQSFEQTFHLLPVAKKMAENCPQSTTKMTPQCHFLQTLRLSYSKRKKQETPKLLEPNHNTEAT